MSLDPRGKIAMQDLIDMWEGKQVKSYDKIQRAIREALLANLINVENVERNAERLDAALDEVEEWKRMLEGLKAINNGCADVLASVSSQPSDTSNP